MPCNVYVSHRYILFKKKRKIQLFVFFLFVLFNKNKHLSCTTKGILFTRQAQVIDFEHNGDWEATSILTLTLITLCTKDTPGKMSLLILFSHFSYWLYEFLFFFEISTKKEKSYQINSEQIEQNVGCRKKVAINLCPFIS